MKNRFVVARALAAAFVVALSATVSAQNLPSTGLGQSWPNSPDLSASPNWHVYVFQRQGVRYIQINDLQGQVLAAVAAANGHVLVLPVGSDADLVTTSTPSSNSNSHARGRSATTAQSGTVIYQDSTTTIASAPLANGTTTFAVTEAACTDPLNCIGGRINNQ